MVCNIYIYIQIQIYIHIQIYIQIQIQIQIQIYIHIQIQIQINVVYIDRGYTKPNPFFLSPVSSLFERIAGEYRR
jgi:hypothetical protein